MKKLRTGLCVCLAAVLCLVPLSVGALAGEDEAAEPVEESAVEEAVSPPETDGEAACNHTLEWIEEIPSTCTENGTQGHYQCSACGALFWDGDGQEEITDEDKDDLVIPAAHTYSQDPIIDEVITEPCNTGGQCTDGEGYQYCQVCGEKGKLPVPIPVEHLWVVKETKEADCATGEDGYTIYVCSNCGTKKEEPLPAQHEFDFPPFPCDEGFAGELTCKLCNNPVEVEIAAADHVYDYENGVKTVYPCTSEEQSVCVYTCTECGDTYTEEIEPSHTWDGGTADENGDIFYTCTECREITYEAPEEDYLLGDVDGDGAVDSWDASLVMMYEVGIITNDEAENYNFSAGDVNEDNAIDSWDASQIMMYEVGIISEFWKD